MFIASNYAILKSYWGQRWGQRPLGTENASVCLILYVNLVQFVYGVSPTEVKNSINVSKINMFRAIIILVGSCTMPATVHVILKKIVSLFFIKISSCTMPVHRTQTQPGFSYPQPETHFPAIQDTLYVHSMQFQKTRNILKFQAKVAASVATKEP